MGTYVFDNSWEKERVRLSGLEATLDPGTRRHLDAVGVSAGWTCLEVGGGGGSIVQWLCRRVGEAGKVIATDLDTRFLDALAEPNLEALRHDIVTDELPEAHFDLIHSRLVLEHLPQRDSVLKRLVSALKPGGWVVLEDFDCHGLFATPPRMFRYTGGNGARPAIRVWQAVIGALKNAGYDAEYGFRLPAEMVALGLEEVGGEVRAPIFSGGSPGVAAHRFTLEHLRDRLVGSGAVTREELDREIAGLDDPKTLCSLPSVMVAAWGRRPEAARATKAVGAMPARRATIFDRLKAVPLFEACTAEELNRIATLAQEIEVPAGEILTHEGAREALFYIIATGTATVTRGGRKLTTLGPGTFFGEVALLTHGPRTATVTADTAMRLLRLEAPAFETLLNDAPTVRRKVLEGVAARLGEKS
jgi:2-polyprenyl-3-methyl-5-hydroxy-6-metoxy-1,4-benzoquinol methylase